MSRQVFLKGALALSISAFISKLLGLFYVIPLKHFAGDEGLALYQLVFPIYNTILILSVSGIPIVLSKLISENLAAKNMVEVNNIVKSALYLMVMISLCGFFAFFFGSSQIASWIGNMDTKLSIQAMAFAMLLVPFVAVFRGYFYGYQQMNLSASSQVIEQLVRVSFMVFIVYWYMHTGKELELVAAGAAFGSFVGLAVALLFLIYVYLPSQPRESVQKNTVKFRYGLKILALSIPVSLSTLMIPLLGMVDSLSIINLLEHAGFSKSMATSEFGIYSRGVPIVQFSSFYATGLALAAVPALASASTVLERRGHINKTIQITLLAGIPASIGMIFIAHPLNILFYGDANGSDTLQVLAASTFFLSLAVTTSGLLQGMGRQFYPALYLVVGMIVKWIGNVWLVGQLGIQGAAYSTLFSYFVISSLCIWTIYRASQKNMGIGQVWIHWIKPSLLMTAVLVSLFFYFPELTLDSISRVHAFLHVLILVITGILSYITGLILFRIITWKDIKEQSKRWGRNSKKSGV